MNPLAHLPIADGPLFGRMVIVGCSARKAASSRALPALELYQGGCVPPLRDLLGADQRLRARVRILSAKHGLVSADTPLLPYDQRLDAERAARLRPSVTQALASEKALPYEALVIAEPLYLVLLTDLLATPTRIHWICDIRSGWEQAAATLTAWGWP